MHTQLQDHPVGRTTPSYFYMIVYIETFTNLRLKNNGSIIHQNPLMRES